jgi:ABC-type multidrug transport system fused ATPase/permease subunit
MSKRKKMENPWLKMLYSLNDSKFFAGIIMLVMNIGSKYIVVELSRTQESFMKYTLGRLLLIFSILWIGTRDIVISLLLTAVFVLLVDYLFNENSRYCIIPEKYKELRQELGEKVTQQEINQAIYTLKKARKKKENSEEDDLIQNTLYKENFI